MDMEQTQVLEPRYDSRQSFYNKALVVNARDRTILYSYMTKVAEIDPNGKAVVYGTYSATTLRHIKEFLKQHGFKAETKAQIEADYEV